MSNNKRKERWIFMLINQLARDLEVYDPLIITYNLLNSARRGLSARYKKSYKDTTASCRIEAVNIASGRMINCTVPTVIHGLKDDYYIGFKTIADVRAAFNVEGKLIRNEIKPFGVVYTTKPFDITTQRLFE